MPFTIYSVIPAGRVVSVQTDMAQTYEVVGGLPGRHVELSFANVNVSGGGIAQAPTFTGADGLLQVSILNNAVRIQPA